MDRRKSVRAQVDTLRLAELLHTAIVVGSFLAALIVLIDLA